MTIKILHKSSDRVLFSYAAENNSISKTISKAARKKVDLTGANLQFRDLYNCDLRFAKLRYSNLKGTYCSHCDFSNADLSGANLQGTEFENCDFKEADLQDCNLTYSVFRECNLTKSNFDNKSPDPDFKDCIF